MRNILACPGCGIGSWKGLAIVCPNCGTLTSKAIKMNATELETVQKNYASTLEAGTKIKVQTQEEHEKDIKDLFG